MAIQIIIKLVISSLLLIFLIIIASSVITIKRKRKERSQLINQSISYIDYNFGNINTIVGHTRSGKTSFVNGLSHVQVKLIMCKLDEKMSRIINYLPDIDFNLVNEVLDNVYINGCSDYVYAGDLLIDVINKKNYVYHDYINVVTFYGLLREYAEYYYIINYRNCYMFSKGVSMYDRVTCIRSKLLDEDSLKLKLAHENKNYIIPRGAVMIVDEISVSDGNSKSFDKESKEDGSKEQKIFLGQMSKELSYYNSTKQVVADEIVTTRRLSVITYQCISCKDKIYNFPRIQRLLDKLLNVAFCLFKLRFIFIINHDKKSLKMDLAYNSKKCKYRKFESFVNNLKNWFDSQGLLVHEGKLYRNNVLDCRLELIDDDVKLMFPLNECRGTYNTHEYSCIQDYLIQESKVSIDEVPFTSRLGNECSIKERLSFLKKESKENNSDGF